MMFFNILLILFSFLSRCQERLLLIQDPNSMKAANNTYSVFPSDYDKYSEKKQKSDIERQMSECEKQLGQKNKLTFQHTDAIINFIRFILPVHAPRSNLITLIRKIQQCHPYTNPDYYVSDLKPGDTVIEFILEKLQKGFFKGISIDEVEQNIEFYTENSIKKVKLKKTIDTQNSLKKEEQESTPPKTNTLFKIKDKNSPQMFTVSCDYFFDDTDNSFDQGNIQNNIKNRQKNIKNNEPIFFTNFNAIKNYIHFNIGYDKNNHSQTRKKLFDICRMLSEKPPYNTKNYQFKPEDLEIIALLNMLEKIHNDDFDEEEFERYYTEIKTEAKQISPIPEQKKTETPTSKPNPTGDFGIFNNAKMSTTKLNPTGDFSIFNNSNNKINLFDPSKNFNFSFSNQGQNSLLSQTPITLTNTINSKTDLKKTADNKTLKISITQNENNGIPGEIYIENFAHNNFQSSQLWDEIQKASQTQEIFFQNLTAIKNYIYCSIKNTDAKKILNDACDSLSNTEPYKDKNHTFKQDDQTIAKFLEIVQKTVNNQSIDLNTLKDSVKEILDSAQLKNSVNEQKILANPQPIKTQSNADLYLRIGIDNNNENNVPFFDYYDTNSNLEQKETYSKTINFLKNRFREKNGPIFFKNIRAIKNFIEAIPHLVGNETNLTMLEKRLNFIMMLLENDPLYRNQSNQSDIDIKENDDLIKYFLKNIEDFIFQKIDLNTVMTNLDNIKMETYTANGKTLRKPHYIKNLFMICENWRNSTEFDNVSNIVSYYPYIEDIKDNQTKKSISDKIKRFENEIEKNKKIFFLNLTAIKNYIYCSIKNDHVKQILKQFCNQLSTIDPYSTMNYTFKKNDETISSFLEILENVFYAELSNVEYINTTELQDSLNKILDNAQLKNSVNDQKSTDSITIQTPATNNKEKLNANPIDNLQIENIKKEDSSNQKLNHINQQNNPENNRNQNSVNETQSNKNSNPKRNFSKIKYLLGLTLCAASLVCLYTFFNPHILKRIYQSS